MRLSMTDISAPKISIIVPMYEVEDFIPDLIESVLNQDFQSWELILVNDGSPDLSAHIASTYAAKDPRINVLNQENLGVSAARNAGLTRAIGEFVTFIDGDDTISPDYLSTMLGFSDANTDYVISLRALESPGTIGTPTAQPWDKDRAISELIYAEIPMGCWNKLYRRSLIADNDLRFIEHFRMGEGLNFITMAAKLATGQIVATSWSGYRYRRTNGRSATSTLNSSKMLNALEAIENIRADQHPLSELVERSLNYQEARTAFSGLVAAYKERDIRNIDEFRSRLIGIPFMSLALAKVPLKRRLEILTCRIAPNIAARLRIVQHALRAK